MTRDQAVTAERARYVQACRDHRPHLAHIHLMALDRLRHPQLCAVR